MNMKLPFFNSRRKTNYAEIDPDEILMDSSNVSHFDRDQFEGRMERPISKPVLYSTLFFFALLAVVYLVQAGNLQIIHGGEYASRSQANMLRPVPYSRRGESYMTGTE